MGSRATTWRMSRTGSRTTTAGGAKHPDDGSVRLHGCSGLTVASTATTCGRYSKAVTRGPVSRWAGSGRTTSRDSTSRSGRRNQCPCCSGSAASRSRPTSTARTKRQSTRRWDIWNARRAGHGAVPTAPKASPAKGSSAPRSGIGQAGPVIRTSIRTCWSRTRPWPPTAGGRRSTASYLSACQDRRLPVRSAPSCRAHPPPRGRVAARRQRDRRPRRHPRCGLACVLDAPSGDRSGDGDAGGQLTAGGGDRRARYPPSEGLHGRSRSR